MTEEDRQVDMSCVLAWHPYSRANDLPEEFGQFSKELEVVARSRGGQAAVDLFSGNGIATSPHIAKTILQSVVFSLTDIYGMCLEQAEKIEHICTVSEHDMVANVKGLVQGERVPIHFGPVPDLFDSLCEYQVCTILRRCYEMWMAVQYVKCAQKIHDGDLTATVPKEKSDHFLQYIATELSEDPLIVDDDMIEWIGQGVAVEDLKARLEEFRAMKSHRVSDFIFMINWSQFYVNLYGDVLTICEMIYTSFGSSSRWDQSPLLLPIVMLSSGAVSLQRTIMNVFNCVIPENAPKMRAHRRLLSKLFPS